MWWRGARLLTLRLNAQHPIRCDSYNCRNCETRVACSLAPGCLYRQGAWGGVCDFNKVPDTGRSFRTYHVFRTHHFVPTTIEVAEERLSVLHDGYTYVDGACVPCSRARLPALAHLSSLTHLFAFLAARLHFRCAIQACSSLAGRLPPLRKRGRSSLARAPPCLPRMSTA